MDRNTRNLIHKKQETISVKRGEPIPSELKEGVLTLRHTNEGLFIYTVYNGSLYKREMIKGSDMEGITIIS